MTEKQTGSVDQPNGSTQDENSTSKKEELTAEAINTLVNSAITGRFKEFSKSFEKTLETKLSSLAPKQATKEEDDPVKAENRELARELALIKNERAQEKAILRSEKLNAHLKEALLDNGVMPEMIKGAMAMLKEDHVKYNDDGDLVWQSDKHTQLNLTDGLKAWVKSDAAKGYLKAPNLEGAGKKEPNRKADSSPGSFSVSEFIGIK